MPNLNIEWMDVWHCLWVMIGVSVTLVGFFVGAFIFGQLSFSGLLALIAMGAFGGLLGSVASSFVELV